MADISPDRSERRFRFTTGNTGTVLSFSQNRRWFGMCRPKLFVCDLTGDARCRQIAMGTDIAHAVFAPDHPELLLASNADGELSAWNPVTAAPVPAVPLSDGPILEPYISPHAQRPLWTAW
jgi:hypothetical protein